jgi:hypothetical protein
VAKVWVQLLSSKAIERQGKIRLHSTGEWVRVGKQLALEWIEQGDAWNFRLNNVAPSGCGIAARGKVPEGDYLGLPVSTEGGGLRWPRTLLWDASRLNLRTNIIPAGFGLLDRWQVVAPVFSYDVLAQDISTDEDRALTQEIIRDLRVPIYDTRLLFLRRCRDVQRLLALWKQEGERLNGDEKLAFMRAVYAVKPTVCAAPTSWTQKV